MIIANEVSPRDDLDDSPGSEVKTVFVVGHVGEDGFLEGRVNVVAALVSGLHGLTKVLADSIFGFAVEY